MDTGASRREHKEHPLLRRAMKRFSPRIEDLLLKRIMEGLPRRVEDLFCSRIMGGGLP